MPFTVTDLMISALPELARSGGGPADTADAAPADTAAFGSTCEVGTGNPTCGDVPAPAPDDSTCEEATGGACAPAPEGPPGDSTCEVGTGAPTCGDEVPQNAIGDAERALLARELDLLLAGRA